MLNKKVEHLGHRTLQFHNIAGLLKELKALLASTSSKASVSSSANTAFIACTAASMPAFTPEHVWSAPQTSSTSILVARAKALAAMRWQHSPIPTGRTPGCLSSAMPRRASRARIEVHGTTALACKRVEAATASGSNSLTIALPNLKRNERH